MAARAVYGGTTSAQQGSVWRPTHATNGRYIEHARASGRIVRAVHEARRRVTLKHVDSVEPCSPQECEARLQQPATRRRGSGDSSSALCPDNLQHAFSRHADAPQQKLTSAVGAALLPGADTLQMHVITQTRLSTAASCMRYAEAAVLRTVLDHGLAGTTLHCGKVESGAK